jgi:hypothetical protein
VTGQGRSEMFWDAVITGVRWAGIVIAFGVFALIAFYLVVGAGHMAKLFTVDLYRHHRYTQNGLCPKCHLPAEVVTTPADQTYGPDAIRQLACTCGAKSIPMGNRRAADWAGF